MQPILILLLTAVATLSFANDRVTIYQLSGQRQCVEGGGVPPEKAADLLRGQGLKVTSAQRRYLPIEVEERCGAPTGAVNLIEVAAADWAAFTRQNRDAGGYGLWVFDEDTVQVYMYDGTLQCGMGEEIPLSQMADALRTKGVQVIDGRKGSDGLVHIAVCGASTGAINVFTIKREDLDAARELGFKVLVSRDVTQRVKRPVSRPAGAAHARALPSEPASPIPLLW